MQEAYGKAIDILMHDKTDYKVMAIEFAKRYPAQFNEVYEATRDTEANVKARKRKEMDDEMKFLIRDNKKVEAIKLCRTITGWGLKEAKDYADALPLTVGVATPTDSEWWV